jgi:hypothetical protein
MTYPLAAAHSLGYIQNARQQAAVDQYRLENGPGSGTRIIRVATPQGLDIEILPDRSLDLGRVAIGGVPLSWLSATGFRSGAAVEDRGFRWLRTFGGGLLATGGLDAIGDPSRADDGLSWGLHGRVGSLPATIRTVDANDEIIRVSGRVVQASVHGEHLLLDRTWEFPLLRPEITLTDVVRNSGSTPQPHMILYHFNLGWPFVSPRATLATAENCAEARNAEARRAKVAWNRWEAPYAEAESEIYRHRIPASGHVATLTSPDAGWSLKLQSLSSSLPWLHQWKVQRPNTYVLGIEPSNCPSLEGRVASAAERPLPTLAPGEEVTYRLRLRLHPL